MQGIMYATTSAKKINQSNLTISISSGGLSNTVKPVEHTESMSQRLKNTALPYLKRKRLIIVSGAQSMEPLTIMMKDPQTPHFSGTVIRVRTTLPKKISPYHPQTPTRSMRISSNPLLSASLPWEEIAPRMPLPNFLQFLLQCHEQRLLPRHIQQQYWAELTNLTYPSETPLDLREALEGQVEEMLWEETSCLEEEDLEEGEIPEEIPRGIPFKEPNSEDGNLLSSMEIDLSSKNLPENGLF